MSTESVVAAHAAYNDPDRSRCADRAEGRPGFELCGGRATSRPLRRPYCSMAWSVIGSCPRGRSSGYRGGWCRPAPRRPWYRRAQRVGPALRPLWAPRISSTLPRSSTPTSRPVTRVAPSSSRSSRRLRGGRGRGPSRAAGRAHGLRADAGPLAPRRYTRTAPPPGRGDLERGRKNSRWSWRPRSRRRAVGTGANILTTGAPWWPASARAGTRRWCPSVALVPPGRGPRGRARGRVPARRRRRRPGIGRGPIWLVARATSETGGARNGSSGNCHIQFIYGRAASSSS